MTRSPEKYRSPVRYRFVAALCALLGASSLSGCVTFYQPLTSLQRPTVVDPRVANFEGMKLLVRCVPGEYLNVSESNLLCRNVASSFRNQGADVDIDVPRRGRSSARDPEDGKPDLIVDLESRLLHEQDSGLLWVLSLATVTLVPAVTEFDFAQDVTIRDSGGSLLATDSLQARFVRYFGIGVFGVNWVLDVLVRDEADELAGDQAKKEFSRDFYGQLNQLVFNARMRSMVLKGFEGSAAGPSSEQTPASGQMSNPGGAPPPTPQTPPPARLDGKE